MILHSHNHNDFEITINLKGEMQKDPELIQALEEERRKIQVFQRELPLCLELITQAIEACKQKCNLNGQSECSEQTSTEGPVLEEFMPLKRASSSDVDYDEQQSHKLQKDNDKLAAPLKKSDWLRSVQLWNQPPEEDSVKVGSVKGVKMNGSGGAFHPFKKDKNTCLQEKMPSGTEAAAASSTAETGGSGGGRKKEEKEGEGQKKSRRCWSPELHKRFLLALQQLGGSQVATPTQIRKLMKVDGLTNDEVKSHLQKYRLHNRRPSPSIHNNNQQAPPFVVVGGIWVPPPEYTTMTSTTSSGEAAGGATSSEIYAPIATLAAHGPDLSSGKQTQQQQQQQQLHMDDREISHSGCGVGYHTSLTTSSSTDTVGA